MKKETVAADKCNTIGIIRIGKHDGDVRARGRPGRKWTPFAVTETDRASNNIIAYGLSKKP